MVRVQSVRVLALALIYSMLKQYRPGCGGVFKDADVVPENVPSVPTGSSVMEQGSSGSAAASSADSISVSRPFSSRGCTDPSGLTSSLATTMEERGLFGVAPAADEGKAAPFDRRGGCGHAQYGRHHSGDESGAGEPVRKGDAGGHAAHFFSALRSAETAVFALRSTGMG